MPTVPELLPDFVQGWYLLQDSGLDQSERNIVLTALNGNFSVQRVAQELRNQWSGCEPHRRREFQGKQSGFWGDVPEGDENETEDYGDTLGDTEGEMNEEGQALMADAESEVQAAMAAIQTAKKTVREARTRQHNVRMARQYYRPQSKGSGRVSSSAPDDSRMTCLRCGRIGHRVANCPQPPQSAQMTSSAEATSSFVFFHDGEPEMAYQGGYQDFSISVSSAWTPVPEDFLRPGTNFLGDMPPRLFSRSIFVPEDFLRPRPVVEWVFLSKPSLTTVVNHWISATNVHRASNKCPTVEI